MANCHKCEKEIGYLQMALGVFGHLSRNFWRNYNLAIFDCPHCKATCQETAVTYYGFIAVFVSTLVGFAYATKEHINVDPDQKAFGFIFLGAYMVGSFFWWKFISILKEPYQFFGE